MIFISFQNSYEDSRFSAQALNFSVIDEPVTETFIKTESEET